MLIRPAELDKIRSGEIDLTFRHWDRPRLLVGTRMRRLDRLDASSARGVWTRPTLALIEANEAVRAPDLAAGLGLETVVFERDVRKLKELGLTESLDVGYRISPRGRALLHP